MPNNSKTKRQLLEEIKRLEDIIAGYKNEAAGKEINSRMEPNGDKKEKEFHFAEAKRIAKIGSFEFYLDDSSQKWSEEIYRIFEHDPQLKEFSQKEFMDLVHPDDRENLADYMAKYFLNNQKIDFEYRIVLPGNRIKYLYSICQPIPDDTGKVIKVIGIIQDITKLKLVEIENENYRNELETLVNKRTSELIEVNNRLEQEVFERKKTEDALSWELNVNSAEADLSSLLLSKQSVTFEEIAKFVLNISQKLTKSKFGFVGYLDPNTGYFNVPTLTNEIFPSIKLEQEVVFKEFKGLWGWVLENKKPLIVNNVKDDPRTSGTPAGHIKIKRFISTPVMYAGELMGKISLANSDFDYSEKEMTLLNRLASFFAVIIQRKRTMDALQESEKFLQSTLDTLPAHIAILDNNGTILAVNKQWKNFADNNSLPEINYGLGMNYLEVCKNAKGTSSRGAKEVYHGLQDIILNNNNNFELEYPCHSSIEKRWFVIKANRFKGEGGIKLVITHENITARKEAEKKISNQNSFLRNILKSITYPFFVIDARDFKVKMANQAARELYGGMDEGCFCYSVSNTGGLCGNHNKLSCMIETVKETKRPAVLEREIKDKFGNIRTFSVHGYPIINMHGEVIQIIEYCIDITEKRITEMKLLLQSAALESADNAIVITDFDGMVTWVNAAFCLLTGYSPDEVIGDNPRILKSGIHPPEFYCQMWDTIKSGKVWRGELINKKKNGSLYTEEMTITPVRKANENITHFIAIKQDVSDRKKAEKEIEETLGKEKELNLLRARFVSTISHEFRTPLTSILASAELLERYNERWTNEKKIEILKRIQTSVDYMEEMLGDVLTINKADSGKMEFNPKPLEIAVFCRGLFEEVRLTANSNHTMSFINRCGENLILHMDEKLLRHIIFNLLSNAIKYSPKGGKIDFIISIEENNLSIIVKDEGIGIADEDQNKLFEPFFRGNNISGISGTGLGLSILKRAVDLHRGIIFFESKAGIGTTFYVKLPSK